MNLTCLTCPDQSFWYGGGLDINPNDPCAYISSLGDASCGQAPGLGLGGFPLFGGIGFGCGSGGGGGYGPGGGTGSPAPGPCTAPLCSPFAQAGAEAAPPGFGPNAILQAFLAACAGNAICEVAVSGPTGSTPGASNLTNPRKKPQMPSWKSPGCAKAIGEIAGGAAITAAEGYFLWWAAPPVLAMISEEGPLGTITALHILPGAAVILFPGVLLAEHGVENAKSCGW